METSSKHLSSPSSTNRSLHTTLEPSAGIDATSLSEVASYVNGCRVVDRHLDFLPWDNEDNVVSLETQMQAFKFAGVFIPLVCSVGVFLNVINCAVFCKLGLKDRINFLLFSLACADLVADLYFFTYTAEYFYTLLLGDFKINGPFAKALTNSGALVLYGATYVSGFISTLIACERCLCITHPLTAKKLLATRTTAVAVCTTSLVIMGLIFFVGEKYKLGCEYLPSARFSVVVFTASEFYRQHGQFVDFLNVVLFGVLLPCVFVVVTTLTTAITAVKLRHAAQWRQDSSSTVVDTREIALTKMLVVLSCLFVVCTAPNLVVRITPLFVSELRIGGRNQNLLMICVVLLYSCAAINCSLNFFFYYRMGTKFRGTLRDCCLCWRSQLEHNKSSVSVLSTQVEN